MTRSASQGARELDAEEEPPGVHMAAAAVEAVGAVEAATVSIKSHLYIWWADVAIQHRDDAYRQRATSTGPGDRLYEESLAGMVSVCAAAFSIEALLGELGPLAMPADVWEKWTRAGDRTPMERRLRETLKHSLRDQPAADRLTVEFTRTIRMRGYAVHYLGDFADPVAHPSGTNTSPENVMFRSEAAAEAVEAMLAVFRALAAAPKPNLQAFADGHRHILCREVADPRASSTVGSP